MDPNKKELELKFTAAEFKTHVDLAKKECNEVIYRHFKELNISGTRWSWMFMCRVINQYLAELYCPILNAAATSNIKIEEELKEIP